MRSLSTDFVYDMRYASENNFLNEKVYYCDNCLLRYNVAKALISANAELINQNLRIKLFDCFRLVSVQRKMWKIMPDSRYVANPNKSGSVHNRGAAVDLTIVDLNGKELDMGTDFDHFGKEAHHDFKELDQKIISNRALLKRIMEDAGFSGIRTEWWHFQYGAKSDFPISTTALCEN
ncbi:MAG: M15 family metallopeptidase [Bacteroidota bacterium]